jgi:hypothetical protein
MEMVPFSFFFFTIRSYNHPSGAHLFKDGNESGQGRFFAGLSKSVTHLCMEDFLHVAVPDLICLFLKINFTKIKSKLKTNYIYIHES